MLRRLCLALAFLLSVFISIPTLSTPALAAKPGDIVVSLNPSEQDLNLVPGEHYTKRVTVYNVGKLPFSFEVEAVPYQTTDENYSPDFSTQNAYTRLANWITFPTTEYTVTPNQAVEVQFNIDVPAGVPGGGQYAAIIIRTSDPTSEDASVSVVAQLASILHGRVAGAEIREEGKMLSHNLPRFLLGSGFHLSTTFENTGNVDYRVTETLTIRDFFTGRDAVTPETTNADGFPIGTVAATILPGTKRTLEMAWPGAPQLGLFKVTHTVVYLKENISVDYVAFLCPIWLLVLVIIIVAMIIIGVVSTLRSRRLDKPQVF